MRCRNNLMRNAILWLSVSVRCKTGVASGTAVNDQLPVAMSNPMAARPQALQMKPKSKAKSSASNACKGDGQGKGDSNDKDDGKGYSVKPWSQQSSRRQQELLMEVSRECGKYYSRREWPQPFMEQQR